MGNAGEVDDWRQRPMMNGSPNGVFVARSEAPQRKGIVGPRRGGEAIMHVRRDPLPVASVPERGRSGTPRKPVRRQAR